MDNTAAELAAAYKAWSMLMVLLATCKQTLFTLDAMANMVDTDLREDLRRMIQRSENELAALANRINALR